MALPPFAFAAQTPDVSAQTPSETVAPEEGAGASEEDAAADFFTGGASAGVDRDVTGDAFAAGGEVRVRGAVRGDAVLAGGEIDVEGVVDDDLYAAGGTLLVASTVKGNARLAGGEVTIAPRGAVLGRATIAGGEVRILGRVGRRLDVYAGRAEVDGEVGGDLRVAARALRIGPGAQIGGRLVYHGAAPAEVSPSAVIAGGIQYTPSPAPDFGSAARVAAWAGAVLLALSLLLVGGLLILAAPEFSAQASAAVVDHPLRSFALGFALLVSVPAAALVAIGTVVGIPLGLLLLLCYPVLALLGYLGAALAIGDRIAQALRRPAARVGSALRLVGLALALVLLALLISIPRAGIFLLLAAIAFGLGAWTLCIWRAYSGRGVQGRLPQVNTPKNETRGGPN